MEEMKQVSKFVNADQSKEKKIKIICELIDLFFSFKLRNQFQPWNLTSIFSVL